MTSMDTISSKVKQGDFTLVKEDKLKSSIWKKFGYVFDGKVKINDIVACFACKKVYSYTGHKSGTSNLLKHSCEIGQSSIITYLSTKRDAKVPEVPPNLKTVATEKLINLVSKDILPFEVACGSGFLETAQFLIDVGAKYGAVSAKELLPHPTTISRNLKETAERLRETVSEEVKNVFRKVGGALTVDLWTDSYRKMNYMGVTAHYINYEGKLEDRVLCTRNFESEIKKTGENIRLELIKILRSFDLFSAVNNIVFVTDRGPNIVAALRQYKRLSCSAHILNTVLEHTTRDANDEDSDVQRLIHSCRAVTTFFKRSGLQNRLQKSLKGDVDTRWNSKLDMFESINSQWSEVQSILSEKNQDHLIETIDKRMLEDVITFLTPFKKASCDLEASKTPTLYLCVLWKLKLLSLLEKTDGDSPFLIDLKRTAKSILISKWEITITHKLATFLNPKYKNLKFLSSAEKDEVLKEAKKYVARNCPQLKDNEETTSAIPVKKQKYDGLFNEFEDSSEDESTRDLDVASDEIFKYTNDKVQFPEGTDLMAWWHGHDKVYPLLSKLAYFVHCIPASSAPSERSFSTAGRIMQDRRTSLKPQTIDDIMFLHSNLPK